MFLVFGFMSLNISPIIGLWFYVTEQRSMSCQTGIDVDRDSSMGGSSVKPSSTSPQWKNRPPQAAEPEKRSTAKPGDQHSTPEGGSALPRSGSANLIAKEESSEKDGQRLEALLLETLNLLEGSFAHFDVDGSQTM